MAAATLFYVTEVPAAGECLALEGDEGHHAARVLRMRAGEPVMLCDGKGGIGDGVVSAADRGGLTVAVTSCWSVTAVQPEVTVVQALPKSDRSELAVELAVEAGADRIVPWQAARCVARWDETKADKGQRRWEAVARAAARQSRRPWLPQVDQVLTTEGLVASVRSQVEDGGVVLVLHESALSGLNAVRPELMDAASVVLIVGPEGGVAEDELELLTSAGAVPVRLGPTVMRTSTAAAVALGALGVLTGRWSSGPVAHR